MELLHGSPADMTGRSDREIRTYAFLDRLGVAFDRTDHPDQPATSMEVCATVDAILGVHICKNLFLCNRQILSADHAGRQALQDEGAVRADGREPPVLCGRGVYGALS